MTTLSRTETAALVGDLPAAVLSDAMERFGVAAGIRPLWPGISLSGPAFTVWTRPGDNAGLHAAFEQIARGEVLVVNGGSDESRALIGELLVQKAKALEIAGIVLDGAARDVAELQELGVPVFARSVTPAGPWKTGPYRTQEPIAIGGVPVLPGDWIVGDDDGVTVIPRARLQETVEAAHRLLDGEAERRAANQALVPRD